MRPKFVAVLILALCLSACSPPLIGKGSSKSVILATTTSTQDSGLLDVLVPAFEKQSGYTVKTVAVGTGAALKLGEQGNADVLLVHAPAAEKEFMKTGAGLDRELVMYNDFVIVGPPSDPAGIGGTKSAVQAFKTIASKGALFVSRGDQSGTNLKELAIWQAAKIHPRGSWYIQSGTGMGDTLRIASEKGAYTLTDRGTYLAQKSSLDLKIMVQKDPMLLNIYHVIQVNPDKFPRVSGSGAKQFEDFLLSSKGQQLIGNFGKAKYGQSLFTPCAGNNCNLQDTGD